ncbi:MAG: hypothetical protein ACREEF_09575, partial [Brevundimonas sp.]
MSSPENLNRILLGSAIGVAIGLVLLALGVAILWNAADQRLADAKPRAKAASAPVVAGKRDQPTEAAASPAPYPAVAPGPSTPPVPVQVEPPRPAASSIWRSIFDDGEERAEPVASGAPSTAPQGGAPPAAAPGPAPRASAPRRPPE